MTNECVQQTSGPRADKTARKRDPQFAGGDPQPRRADRTWAGIAGRYGLAVVAVATATAVKWWLGRSYGVEPTFVTFYPAVLLAASIGGGGPGIVATVLAALAADYWIIPPVGFGIETTGDTIALGIFTGSGVFLSGLAERLRRTRWVHAVSVAQARELSLVNLGNLLVRDWDGRIVRWSEGCQRLYGFAPQEAQGQVSHELLQTRFAQPLEQVHRALLAQGRWEGELIHRCKDGTDVNVASLWVLRRDGTGQPPAILEVDTDITARKRAEEALLKAKQEWERTFDSVPDLIAILDDQHRIVQANRAMAERLQRVPEACVGLHCYEGVHGTKRPPAFCPHVLTLADGQEHEAEVHEDCLGGDFLVSTTPLFDERGKLTGAVHVARDITERKKREEELRRLNRTLTALGNSNLAMGRAQNEAQYLEEVCRIIVEDCGHAMVWVGYAEDDENKTVRPMAHAGFDAGYMESLNITWEDTERGRGPTGTAIRTGQPSMCRNMLTDPRFAPWREEALKRGYASSVVLPLLAEGRAFGALTIYSRKADPFSDDEVRLLSDLANDLAHGITALRLRQARAQAEGALRNSEQRLRWALQAAGGGAWDWDLERDDAWWSPEMYDLWGVEPGTPRSLEDSLVLIHEQDRPRLRSAVEDAIARRTEYKCEFRIRHPARGERWMASQGRLGFDESGRPVRLTGISLDVTERKRAAEQIRTTLESIGDGFFACDADWRFVYVNAPAERSLGIRREDVLGRSHWEVFPLARGTQLEEEYRRAAAGEARDFENFYEPWGRWFHNRCFPREGGGMSVYFEDITERKRAERSLHESEERLRFALETSHTGAWDLDLVDHTAFRSLEHDRIFGHAELLPQWTYEMFLEHVLPEDRDVVGAKFCEATATQGDWNFECRIRRPDGEVRWILAAGRHRTDAVGGQRRMAGIVQDITERKQAEQAILQAAARFEILSETASALLQTTEPQKVVETLCQKVMEHLDCHIFVNYLVDEPAGRLHLNASAGMPERTTKAIEWLDFGQAICGRVAQDGQRIVAENIQESCDSRADLVRSFGIRAYACHPIIAQERVIGTLSFGTRSRGTFTDDDLALMKTVTDQVATAMERIRAQQALQELNEQLELRVQQRTAELRQSIEMVEAERRRFKDVLDQLPAYLALLTPDYHVSFANRFFEERFGKSEGRRCYEYLFNRSEPCEICETYRVLQTNAPHDWEWLGPDGHNYDVHDFPFTDVDGTPLILEVGLDITERKKAEEALRLASAYNRTLLEASLDPLVTIDADGKITDVNAATEKVTGRTRQELIGTDFSNYFTEPDRARSGYQQVFREGSVQDYALDIRHRDGHRTPVLYNAAVYRDESGKVRGVFAAARDVTAPKKAEEALRVANAYNRSLLEASLDPLVTIDADGKITDVNAATEKVTGCARQKLLGTDFSDYFTEPERARAGYQQVFREGAVQDYALEIRNRDGHHTPVLYNASVYRNAAGEALGVFAAARDITERRRVEEELRRLNEELEQRVAFRTAELAASNKELEAFAYSVSHDLRTPLRAMDGFSQALLEDYADKLDSEGRNHLQRVRAASQHMGELIDGILSLSRTTRSEMRRTAVNVSALAQAISLELQRTAPERQVDFVIAPRLTIHADARLLRILLENLMRNAWKFTSKHPQARIEVGSVQHEGETAYYIRDDGAGFDMAYANKLFGAFQRLHTTEEFEGTGVGLATVQRIVHRHGGRVWAEGEVGKGATFYFTMPRDARNQ